MNILFFLSPKQDLMYVYDDFTLRQTLEKWENNRYASIPVLNRRGEYVGTLTEGDILWGLKKYHGLGGRERLLLQISAILHSCGKFISMRNSNECSYNIIMSTEIIGLSHLEREIIANVVRYNIRDFDYDKVQLEGTYQEGTVELDQKGMTILIAKLTAILRLANSMDRSHRGKLADCRMSIREGELVITTGYEGDIALEAMSFEQKADFFEEIYGIRPVLRQKRRI